MRLGLDTLATESRDGERRVAILGTMAELGESATPPTTLTSAATPGSARTL